MKLFFTVIPLLFSLLIAGCGKSEDTPYKKLTCKDSPVGKTKEQQQEISDDCFRAGTFKPSPPSHW